MAWALSGLSYIVRSRVTVPEAEPGMAKPCIQLCAVAEDRGFRNEMIEYLKAPFAPGVGGLISAILPNGYFLLSVSTHAHVKTCLTLNTSYRASSRMSGPSKETLSIGEAYRWRSLTNLI